MEAEAYRQMAEEEAGHWFWLGRRAIFRSVLDDSAHTRDGTVLEVGAGTGGNIEMLAKYGRIHAIEMDVFARQYAEEKTGIRVLEGSLPDDFPYRDRKFDIICLFDVLEHIENSVGALTRLSAHLNEDGFIVISVPAYMWMWSDWDDALHHFRRYTRSTLRAELEQAGFKVKKLSHFNTILFPLAATVRLASKFLGIKASAGSKKPNAFINALMFRIFSLERHLLRWFDLPYGLSVLAVAYHHPQHTPS